MTSPTHNGAISNPVTGPGALCPKELCLAGRRQYRHGRLQKASAVNFESCRARSLEKLICFKVSFWVLFLVSPLKDPFGDFAVFFIRLLSLRMIPIRSKAHVKTVRPSQPRNTWYHLASLWHCWHSPWHCSRGWWWHSSTAGHRRVAGLGVHFHAPWVLGILTRSYYRFPSQVEILSLFAPPLLFLVHHMLQPPYPPPTWILRSTPIKAFHITFQWILSRESKTFLVNSTLRGHLFGMSQFPCIDLW